MVKYLNKTSHEARTLMTGIVGVAQLMLNSKDVNSDTRENVEIIIDNSYSLLGLFDELIDRMQTECKIKKVA